MAFHINLKCQREEPLSLLVGFITPIVSAAAQLQIEVGSGPGTAAVLVTGTENCLGQLCLERGAGCNGLISSTAAGLTHT